jgi:hypothetical protein
VELNADHNGEDHNPEHHYHADKSLSFWLGWTQGFRIAVPVHWYEVEIADKTN